MSGDVQSLVSEYSDWLKINSSNRPVDSWHEITVPFLDHANDHFQFYSRLRDGVLEFMDDGYTLNGLENEGVNFNGRRSERLSSIVKDFGASLDDVNIRMQAKPDNSADAMNRYV